MSYNPPRFAVFFMMLAFSVGAGAAEPKFDVSGNWDFKTDINGQPGIPQFVLKLDGNKLGGKYKGQFGDADVNGTVDGDKIEFQFATASGPATYKGTLVDKDHMKGNADYGGANQGTWTAERGTGKSPAAVAEAERRARELGKVFETGQFAEFKKYMAENFASAMQNVPEDRHEGFFRNVYGTHGGLEFHSIQETRPTQIVALYKSKKTGGWAAIRIAVQPEPPHLIAGMGGAPPVPPKDASSDK